MMDPTPAGAYIGNLSFPFNLTLGLSGLTNFFGGMFRLKHSSDSLDLDSLTPEQFDTLTADAIEKATVAPVAVAKDSFPGPWAFFTSAYMLGLFTMAILMHRIQHVVVPLPAPVHNPTPVQRRRRSSSSLSSLFSSSWPMRQVRAWGREDGTLGAWRRFIMHLPTSYWLLRMLTVWCVLLGQVYFDETTSIIRPYISKLGLDPLLAYVEHQQMSSIAWQTFCAICAAFCTEGIVKGLDSSASSSRLEGFGRSMEANSSPFNLVGYAFLLHIYSSPLTHGVNPSTSGASEEEKLPSRPDVHVVLTLLIPLLQLTLFHLFSAHKSWSRHRLGPTALGSCLSLIHFWGTILYRWKFATTDRESYRVGAIGRYPLLNYIPNIFESALILSTLLTILLNLMTQLILTGKLSRPLLNFPPSPAELENGADVSSNSAKWWSANEDFGVLLLRVGTASLEAAPWGAKGWGNQVASIHAVSPVPSSALVLGTTGVMDMTGRRQRLNRRRRTAGWNNEIRSVQPADALPRSNWFGIPGVIGVSYAWLKAVLLWIRVFGITSAKVVKLTIAFRGGRKAVQHALSIEGDEGEQGALEEEPELLYQRFLRGEDLPDSDGDSDWSDAETPQHMHGSTSESFSEDEEDATVLYSDLGAGVGETLLAHMAHQGVVTRRRAAHLRAPEYDSDQEDLDADTLDTRSSITFSSSTDSGVPPCVICTGNPRDVIVWPCRCLALCDSCRIQLSLRSSGAGGGNGILASGVGARGKDRCPCCRSIVEGYSKVYLP